MLSVKTGDIEKFIHHTVLSQNWHQADTNENESVTLKTQQSKHFLEHTVLHITGAYNLIKIEGEMQVASPLLSFILPSANKLRLL